MRMVVRKLRVLTWDLNTEAVEVCLQCNLPSNYHTYYRWPLYVCIHYTNQNTNSQKSIYMEILPPAGDLPHVWPIGPAIAMNVNRMLAFATSPIAPYGRTLAQRTTAD
jgi:hypothetical protein